MDTGEGWREGLDAGQILAKTRIDSGIGSCITCMEPMEPLITTQQACTQRFITQIQTRI